MGRNDIARENIPPRRGDWQRLAPGLIISLAAIGFIIYFTDWDRFWQAVQLANYSILALAMLLSFIWLAVRGIVWRSLLQEKASYRQVFLTVNEGYLLNYILPFRLGEIGRAFLISQKAGLDFFYALSTIVLERIFDLALAAGILLVTLPFVTGVGWARQAGSLVGILVAGVFLVLYLAARNQARILNVYNRLGERWPWLRKIGGQVAPQFLAGLAVLMDGHRFLKVMGWVLINWGIAVVQYTLFVRAFFPQSQLLWGAFCLGVIALGVAAPSSPGAVGVLEVSTVAALSVFGLDASTALAVAISVHITQYLFAGVIGSYGLAQDGQSLAGLYRQVRALQTRKTEP